MVREAEFLDLERAQHFITTLYDQTVGYESRYVDNSFMFFKIDSARSAAS